MITPEQRAQRKRIRSYLRTEAAVRVEQMLDDAIPEYEEAKKLQPDLSAWQWADEWLSRQIAPSASPTIAGELVS